MFVSYAHVDNAPIVADYGWVDELVRILEQNLDMKLGRTKAFSTWRDTQSLRGNYQISGHIPAQVKKSAVFLAVLSTGYLASPYCMRELNAFVENARDNVEERIFIISKDPTDEARLPAEFRDFRGYQFWIRDSIHKPRVLGWPLPQPDIQDRPFYNAVGDVATDIVAKLGELNRAARGDGATPIVTASAKYDAWVLLAEVTDDLEWRRAEVRRYLNQRGIGTLPTGSYRTGSYRLARSDFERAICADLKRCEGFVQLLGPFAANPSSDLPEGLGLVQFELARKHNIPILQWRAPELSMDEVTSPEQRQFLQSESVLAIPIEEFKRNIVEATARRDIVKSDKPHFLFVNAAPIDMAQAHAIVADLDVYCEMPVYEPGANAEAVQKEIEPRLVDCDALVVIYGKAGVSWAVSQFRQYQKLAPRRKSNPRLLAVVGETKDLALSIPIKLPGMAALDINEAPRRIKEAFAM
jgi:hypothetical protein